MIGQTPTIAYRTDQAAADEYRAAAHPLGNAAGAINHIAIGADQNQVAHRAFILHNRQDFHAEFFDACPSNHRARDAMRPDRHFGQRQDRNRRLGQGHQRKRNQPDGAQN